MARTRARLLLAFLVVLLGFAAPAARAQCISLTALGSASTQTFDALSNTAGSTTNNLTITGWAMTETGGGARDNEQYAVDTGASNTGDTYSYGSAAAADRALGGLRSGTLIPNFGACFTNNTGATITSLDVAYNGEEWRLGTAARTDRIDFQYSLDATSLVTGTWTDVNALDFTTPNTVTAGAKDGNNVANRTALSNTISALSIANGATFWIRWQDLDAAGADDGLAVDDFSLTPQGSPPLPTLNVGDVTQTEGASGTTTFAFTVSLTAPAGPGGVTFDIATADNTATTANSDYVANSVAGATIPAGSSTYTFNVTVNGDNNAEPTETFFVNVTSITNANAGDVQGTGTITTDDAPPDLTVTDVTQIETNSGTTTFAFTVNLSAPAPPGGVTFDIATANGTAAAGSDYVARALTGQTIAAGNTSFTFNVTVNGDAVYENSETFFVNVTNVTGANVTDGQGLGTIGNDDAQPLLTIADLSAAEGNAGTSTMTFTVTLTGATEVTASVNVGTTNASATSGSGDYAVNAMTLTFTPGDTSETFAVTVNGDATNEGDEHFTVDLTAATGATISDSQALGVIRNDDPVSIAAVDTFYSENFDSLATTTSPATPPGWTFVESGSSANLTYSAGSGTSTTGDTYSFGSAAERAFGGLQSGALVPTVGALYRNDTGTTITSLAVQYTGEQWRLGTASRADRLDFQYSLDATSLTTGTWTDVDALDFSTPNQVTAGSKDGNAAGNRTTLTATIGGLSIAPGATFWIRLTDFNASGADDGLAVDDFRIVANYTGSFVSINDASAFEGNAGTTTFAFTVSLSAPAPAGGVTFDIATQDNTATTAGGDYVANTLTSQTIAAGGTSYTFNVTVNGDAAAEATESFLVNVTNVTNALVADGQGVGTIVDDDTPVTLIHAIQGNGTTSPLTGSSVTIRGIVTGVKSNGFFVQEEDAEADADPLTSEGIFVFTSGTPPAAAAMGNRVQVSGTVAEFVPSSDPQQPPLTELTSPTVVLLATGQPLPAAVPLTATFPSPSGAFDQLERVEGMRVTVTSLTVSGPSDGSFTETTGAGTSNGRFYSVVTGVARPFREAGIQAPDAAPSGTIPPIPRWDFNPERLKVDSAALTGQPIVTVKSGDVVGPVTGPLDYGFRAYAIYPDGTSAMTVAPATLASIAPAPTSSEFTVASFNLQRLFDDINDPIGDPVVNTTAYQNRLGKASIAIRNHLRFPDIIGVQEAEKIEVLQALAARISSDAIANSQSDPMYAAYLVEGNDVGGIDVGFLVRTAPVATGVPRVAVNAVVQEGKTTTWIDPSTNAAATLNDRPPLRLMATINRAAGVSFDVTVINNHLRSLNGIDSTAPDGLTTEGDRVRRKRQTQAEFLANLVQARQTSDPAERIILVGDFNAFEVNDGYADLINTILGTPTPDNETVVPGDGVDLVNPNLDDLVDSPAAAERYSYVFEGNAQNLDHVIVNQALISSTSARRVEHPRVNADYPETERNNSATALRLSDHDPTIGYFAVPQFVLTDFAVDLQHATGYATAGQTTTYTIVVTNNGPDSGNATLTFPLPASMTFATMAAPPGWSCTTPAAGANGTVTCTTTAPLAVTSSSFTVTATVGAATPANTVINATATIAAAGSDTNAANNSDSVAVTSLQPSQYRATKSVSGTFKRGSNVTYTIAIFNDKPFAQGDNAGNELTDVLPSSLTLVSATATSGTALANSGTNTVTWNGAVASGANVTITITATINAAASGTVSNQATLSDDFDNNGTNERNTSSDDPSAGGSADPTVFTVVPPAGLVTATKSVGGTFVAGTNVTYTIVMTNNMALGQADNAGAELTDVLPSSLTLVSASATSGTATATVATNTATWNGSLAPGASVTITLVAQINAAATGTVSNQATLAYDGDANGTNEQAGVSDDPSTAAANDPTSFTIGSPAGLVTVSKSVSGTFVAGTNVTYTIVFTNNQGFAQGDNPGNELTDVLPSSLTLLGASATSGTAVATLATNTVTWNGTLGAGASTTITITAQINAGASGTVSNQATVAFDADNNGTNEQAAVSNDPSTAAANDPTSFAVVPAGGLVTATKSASGTFVAGSAVTYTIVLRNNMGITMNDNAGSELTDVLPSSLTLVSASATSGTAVATIATRTVTWNGSLASGASTTITINALIAPTATGTVSNQAAFVFDADGNGTSEQSGVSDDPATATANDPTVFTVVTPLGLVTATKSASGTFVSGTNLTYTIVLRNNMPIAMNDNAGAELTDVLPAALTPLSASATSGTASVAVNTVTWNGSLAPGASVTITIVAQIRLVFSGPVSNQATFVFDADGNGTSEQSGVSDDPSTAAPNDATTVNVAASAAIPTLSETMLLALAAMLAGAAALKLRG